MILVVKLSILVVFTVGNLWYSRRSLLDSRTHGFYRTFSWEAILILIVLNVDSWFQDPFAAHQILSWLLLLISLILVIEGFRLLRKIGSPDTSRADSHLTGIEKTTKLVTSGIFGYIRHPLYSSLLFLTWGVFFKTPTIAGVSLAMVSSVFLYVTAKIEEVENLAYFGEVYRKYMEKTKMFIPFII